MSSLRRSCACSYSAMRRRALRVARGLVVAEAAGPLAHAMRVGLDRRDAVDRAIEELAVVRDDHERAAIRAEEPLEPFEPVEVEVVRRLVEEQQIEAGEQDRGQRDPGRLTPGQADELALEVDAESEVGAGRPRPRVEALGAERHEAVERHRVAVLRGEPGRESARRVLELALRLVDPDLTGEPLEHGDARAASARSCAR